MQNGDNEKTRVETKDINWGKKVGGWRDNKTTSRLQAHLWLAVHTDKISTLWRRPHPQRTARERGEAQTVSVVHFITLLFTLTHTHTNIKCSVNRRTVGQRQPFLNLDIYWGISHTYYPTNTGLRLKLENWQSFSMITDWIIASRQDQDFRFINTHRPFYQVHLFNCFIMQISNQPITLQQLSDLVM